MPTPTIPSMAPNYADGKVYCIRNDASNNAIVYIGSTVRPISERMAGHRKTIKEKPNIKLYRLMSDVGIEHFSVDLLCNFPCTTRKELIAEEGRYIRLHKTVENGANMCVAGRSQREHYQDNRAHLLQQKREYYTKNAVELRQKDKAWYAVNKEKAADQNKAYRLLNKDKVKAYADSRKEIDAAKNKKWREDHAEELKAKRDSCKDATNAAARAKYALKHAAATETQ